MLSSYKTGRVKQLLQILTNQKIQRLLEHKTLWRRKINCPTMGSIICPSTIIRARTMSWGSKPILPRVESDGLISSLQNRIHSAFAWSARPILRSNRGLDRSPISLPWDLSLSLLDVPTLLDERSLATERTSKAFQGFSAASRSLPPSFSLREFSLHFFFFRHKTGEEGVRIDGVMQRSGKGGLSPSTFSPRFATKSSRQKFPTWWDLTPGYSPSHPSDPSWRNGSGLVGSRRILWIAESWRGLVGAENGLQIPSYSKGSENVRKVFAQRDKRSFHASPGVMEPFRK